MLIMTHVVTGKKNRKWSFLMKISPGSFPSHGTLGVRMSKTPMPAIARPVIMRIFPGLDKGLMAVRRLRIFNLKE